MGEDQLYDLELDGLITLRILTYIEDIERNRLGLYLSEMMDVMDDREVWRLNPKQLPLQLSRKSERRRKKIVSDEKTSLGLNGKTFSSSITVPARIWCEVKTRS